MRRALIAILILVTFPVAADAKRAGVRTMLDTTCAADVRQVCGDMVKGHDKLSCLLSRASQISDRCVAAMHRLSCNPNAPLKMQQTFPCDH